MVDPGEREIVAAECKRKHQAVALAPVRERRCRVYKQAPGFRPGPRVMTRVPVDSGMTLQLGSALEPVV